jgi:hypothetical protein
METGSFCFVQLYWSEFSKPKPRYNETHAHTHTYGLCKGRGKEGRKSDFNPFVFGFGMPSSYLLD